MASPPLALWGDRFARLALGGAAPAFSALTGLLRNKWLAVHLETVGLGVIGQLNASQAWLGTLTGMGLGFPLAREVGARGARGDEEGVRRAVWTAMAIILPPLLVIVAIGLAAAGPFAVALLGSADYAPLVRLSMLGVAGLALQYTLQGLYAGRSDLRAPLTMAVAGGLVSLVLTLALVPRLGLWGGVLGAASIAPVAVTAALVLHRRRYARAFSPRPRPMLDRATARAMLSVAAAGLVLGLFDVGALLGLRAHFLRVHGIAANGLFQAAIALSQQVAAVFYAYLANYAFGRISGAAGLEGLAGIVAYTRKQWTPIVLAATACFVVAMLTATPLLHLLYSDRFDAARPMLAWTIVGDFGKVAAQTWALGAVPLGGVRLWLPTGMSFGLSMLVAYPFSSGSAGPLSLPQAYAAAGLGSFAVCGTLMSRRGVTLGPRGLAVGVGCAAVLVALAVAVSR
jgi:O-antigen/teichoic acid export membrane protein